MDTDSRSIERLEQRCREAEAELARLSEVERRESHIKQVLLGIRNVNQLIVQENDPERLIEQACANFTETLGYRNAWMALFDDGGKSVTAAAASGFDGSFGTFRERLEQGAFPWCVEAALDRGDTLVVEDPEAMCRDCALRSAHSEWAGLCRGLTFNGRLRGFLAASVPAEYAHDPEEQALFDEVAGDLAFALYKIEMDAQLREQERQLREAQRMARLGHWYWDIETGEVEWSEEVYRIFGRDPADFTPNIESILALSPWPEEQQRGNELIRRATESRDPGEYEQRFLRPDGSIGYYVSTFQGEYGNDGALVAIKGTAQDITERERTGEALRQRTVLLSKAEELSGCGAWDLELDSRHSIISENLRRIAGLDSREVSWDRFNALVPAEDLPRIADALSKALDGEEPYDIYHGLIRETDGRRILVHSRGEVVRDKRGEPVRIIGVLQDITERQQHEQALAESEERYRALVMQSADCLILHDLDGRIVDVNPCSCRTYGFTRDELLKMKVSGLDPDYDERANGGAFYDHMRPGEATVFEARQQTKCGRIFPVEVRLSLVEFGGQTLVQGLCRDISQRRRAEQELRQSEARFRSFVENANDLVYSLSPQGTFTYVSPNWHEFMGEPADEALGKPYEPYVHPEDRPLCRAFLDEVLTTGKKRGGVTYRVRHAAGSWRWHVSNGAPMRDEDGNVTAYVGIARDVTQAKQAEDSLRRSEARYRSLAENFPDGALFIIGRDHRYLAADGKALAAAGLRREDIAGRTVREVFPELADELEQHTQRALEGEKVYYEVAYRGRLYSNQAVLLTAEDGSTEQVIIITQDITERKRAEEALRESEARFERMLAVVPDMISIHDPEMNILYSNWQGFGAVSPEKRERGGKCYGVYRGFDAVCPDCRAKSVLETGRPLAEERELPDGSWVDLRVIPLLDAKGDVEMFMEWVRDITEQKLVEREINLSRELLRTVLDIAPVYICAKNRQGRFLLVNKTLADFYETTVDAMTGVLHADLCEDPDELEAMLAADAEVLDRGQPVFIPEETMEGPGGTVSILSTHKIPFQIGGEPAVLIVASDITERKRSEEALRESEERFRLLLNDIVSVSVQGYAPDGTTQYWNKGSELLYGYTAEEALGRNLLELIIPPGMQDEVRVAIQRMAESGEPIPPRELELMRKDGSRVQVYSSHCIVHPHGRPQELFCIDIDLTEIKRAEEERERLQTQLTQAQKMESVGRLAGGVAHDFNNMLNVILGQAELALDSLPQDAELREELEEIRGAAKRSADLTRQLLAFARRQTVSPKVLDLNETVESMLRMLRRLIGEDIALSWRPARVLAPVYIDPAQVDQVLANLTVNARDAIDGVGKIIIETDQAEFHEDYCAAHPECLPGRYVMLAVSDDGPGMDVEVKAQLFEPFFTTKAVGEGTGLGLATVHGIVRQNGGFVNVYSEPGHGAVFRIYFPVYTAGEQEKKTEIAPSGAAVGGHGTILLVEDEPAILNVGRKMLEKLGYAVLTASTPGEAIRLAKEHPGGIDLLVTDVVMPEMNGRDLAKRLLSLYPDMKRLFMSGYTADIIAHQGVLEQGVNFLQKPFSRDSLAAKVNEILKGG